MRVAVVRTLWNSHITEALMAGAVDEFYRAGLADTDVDTFHDTGAEHLTAHSLYLWRVLRVGVWRTQWDSEIPSPLGVLTVDTEQDALDRAGGSLGNKGTEAAQAALLMFDFAKDVENL